jgi:hydrogenase nickel incorporation protein HypA/HybF
MHEASVVSNIIDIVLAESGKHKGKRVTGVVLEIGSISGIEYGSLEFALKYLAPGTVIESAEISIEKPEGRARCNNCGNEFSLKEFLGCCPHCNSFDLSIIQGRELRIKSITME